MKATVKKVFIGIAGGILLAIGIAMIVLPGPAFIVIPAALAILATEFQWAHNLKERFRHRFHAMREKHREKKEAQGKSVSQPASSGAAKRFYRAEKIH